MKYVICSSEKPYWFWLTQTLSVSYLSLTCEMFTLARKAVTFCSAHSSLSYIVKTCNSMLFLSSLTQRFPNHGKDPCQPSLCLLEHLDFYCSTLNRIFKNSWFSRPTTNFYNLASHPWIKGGKCCFDQKGANFLLFSL